MRRDKKREVEEQHFNEWFRCMFQFQAELTLLIKLCKKKTVYGLNSGQAYESH